MLNRLVILPLLHALNWLAADTAARLGGSLGVLAFHLGVRRRVASGNIAATLGLRGPERRRVLRRSYATMGANFLELWTIGGPDGPERHLQLLDPLWQAYVHRRHPGAVFLTPHLGDWDLAGHSVTRFLPGFVAYAKVQHNPEVDAMVNAQRRRADIGVAMTGHNDRKAAVAVLRGLRQGAPVGLMADQRPSAGEGVPAFFLGIATDCHPGPGFFARRARVPIIPGFGLRLRAGVDAVFIGRPLPYHVADDAALVQASMDLLSAMIAAFPGQYFWQHRRFARPLDLPPRAYEPWRRWGLRLMVEPEKALGK
jgi:KDO2-lipid IV(A) lauroyltransferase